MRKAKDVFKTDGSKLFCNYYEKVVIVQQKTQLHQHQCSAKHKELNKRREAKISQTLLPNSMAVRNGSKFKQDLCLTFVSANIPLSKLLNRRLVTFLEQYTNEKVPNQSTLRKKYVVELFDIQMSKIRQEVEGKYLWISIDETTDITGRYIANVVVGILDTDPDTS